MKTKTVFSLIIFLLLLTHCKKSEIEPTDIEQDLINEIQALGLPSTAICIVNDEEIEWEWVYGHANLKTMTKANELTLYNLMSISKVFIATAAMQLVEEGRLELDKDINTYLPYSVRNPKYPDLPISMRMLLNHTSGIAHPDGETWYGEIYELYPFDEMPRINQWVPEYILSGGSSYRSNVWKDFKPGEAELYSNIATSLAAIIIEQISGMTYEDYCWANIFEPLEMNNTALLYEDVDMNLLALPYYNMSAAYPLYNFKSYPAANVKSNLEDFSHFMIAILNKGNYKGKRILEETSVEEMFELNNTGTGVGLIWRHCPGDCIGHNGGGEGFSTRFELFPERKQGMLLLSNRRNTSVYPQGRIYNLVRLKMQQF